MPQWLGIRIFFFKTATAASARVLAVKLTLAPSFKKCISGCIADPRLPPVIIPNFIF